MSMTDTARNSMSRGRSTAPAVAEQRALTPAQKNFESIKHLVEAAQLKIASVLPAHVKPDRMIRIALATIGKNEKLMQCSPASIVTSLLAAAELGLDAGGSLGSAYLVPYNGTCQLIPGYRGLIDLARRSGQIETIEAHVVYERDSFELQYGTDSYIKHTPCIDGDPGKAIGAYAVARLRGGAYQWEWMSKRQIEAIRAKSKAGNSGPWVDQWDEMARKTLVRRICKYLPLSPELQSALEHDDAVDQGITVETDYQVADAGVIDTTATEVTAEQAE